MYSRVHPGSLDHLRQLGWAKTSSSCLHWHFSFVVPLDIQDRITASEFHLCWVGGVITHCRTVWPLTSELLLDNYVVKWHDVLQELMEASLHLPQLKAHCLLGGWAGRGFWQYAKTDSCFPFFSIPNCTAFWKAIFLKEHMKEKELRLYGECR